MSALFGKCLIGKCLIGKCLIGKCLIGKRLIGKCLIGKCLIGKRLIGKCLIGKRLIGMPVFSIRQPFQRRMNSSTSRSALDWLHSLQAQTQLTGVVCPPLARGSR